MHLWPSMRLRDSFKIAYLKRLELNLHLMKLDKKKRQQDSSEASTSDGNNENDNQQKLLSSNIEDPSKRGQKFIAICRELLLIISCCYCCFGCGACVDDEGN